MGKYSQTLGSFSRTGNYPLEANYIFHSEQELIDFYSKNVNKLTLHEGLFKIVVESDDQHLYWVVRNEDSLIIKRLISESTISELEQKIETSTTSISLNSQIQDAPEEYNTISKVVDTLGTIKWKDLK